MSVAQEEWPLGEIFTEAKVTEDKVAALGAQKDFPDRIARAKHSLEYETAIEERDTSIAAALEVLEHLEDGAISPAHKRIALEIMRAGSNDSSRRRNDWGISIAEREELIREGFDIYDRLAAFLDHPDELVLVREKVQSQWADEEGGIKVALFNKAPELVLPKPMHGHTPGIVAVFHSGVRVFAVGKDLSSFPDISIEKNVSDSFSVFGDLHTPHHALSHLKKWDSMIATGEPSYDKLGYHRSAPAVTFLGTPEQPAEHQLELDDRQIFSIRLAADLMGQADWLPMGGLSKEFSEGLAREFSTFFADLLIGKQTSDSDAERRPRRAPIRRHNALGAFPKEELQAIFRAAKVSEDEIRSRTRNMIDQSKGQATAYSVRRALVAEQSFEEFFNILFSKEN